MEIDCSIIIPAYNVGNVISNCLEKLQRLENVKYNYEIIVVNDGSEDDTVKMVEKYAEKNSIIKLINKKNGGVSSARNTGLRNALGRWIYFVDADDEVNINTLEYMIEIGSENDTDIIIANYYEKNNCNDDKIFISCELPINKRLEKLFIERTVLRRYFNGNNKGLSTVWNKVYSKEVLTDILFDEKRTHGEDWKFNIECFSKANRVLAIEEPLYIYTKDGTQNYSKYRKNLSFCLIEGHRIAQSLNEKYHYCNLDSEEYRNFMIRFLNQSIKFIELEKCSDKEKKNFLKNRESKKLYQYLMKLKKEQLGEVGLSRKDKVAFLLLYLGKYRQALNILKN